MPVVSKYYEFVTDKIWERRNGTDVTVSYLLMEYVDGVRLIDFFNSAIDLNEGHFLDEKYYRFVFQ